MIVIIIDTYNDVFGIKKEFPHPMELKKETEENITVLNKGVKEIIRKSQIKNIYKINLKNIN